MGAMMRCLGCRVVWDKDYMKVRHPKRGDLKVRMIGGCPQISQGLALRLIEETEENTGLTMAGDLKSRSMLTRSGCRSLNGSRTSWLRCRHDCQSSNSTF